VSSIGFASSPAPSALLVVVGEGGLTGETSRDVRAFCEANALPVACAFRCQDFVDNRSPSYVGVLGVAMDEAIAGRLRDADLVLAIGGRLGEVPTRRYTLLEPPDPRQTLVHVHPDAGELGRVYQPDLAIVATLTEFASALCALDPVEPRLREWTSAARADYEENLRNEPLEGDVDLGEIMAFLRTRLPGDAVQTCGAGNFTVWAHRFAEFTQFGTQACPRSGSMGYGLPAAVAAQLIHPQRIVVCFTGDGDFVMSSPELATRSITTCRSSYSGEQRMYATIRMHQGDSSQASSAPISEPGLSRACACYWRMANGRANRGTRGCVRCALPERPSVLELPSIPSRSAARGWASCGDAREPRGDKVDGLAEPIALHGRCSPGLPVRLRDRGGRPRRPARGRRRHRHQTRRILRTCGRCWRGGCDFEDVVKVTVFLTDRRATAHQPGAPGGCWRVAACLDPRRSSAPCGRGRQGRDRVRCTGA
jgi:hypothetical protein